MKKIVCLLLMICISALLWADENKQKAIQKKISFIELCTNICSIELEMLYRLQYIAKSKKFSNAKQERNREQFLQTLALEIKTTLMTFIDSNGNKEKNKARLILKQKLKLCSWNEMLVKILQNAICTYKIIIAKLKSYPKSDANYIQIRTDWIEFYQWQLERRKKALKKIQAIFPTKLSQKMITRYRNLLTKADICIRLAKNHKKDLVKKTGQKLEKTTKIYQESLYLYYKKSKKKMNCSFEIKRIVICATALKNLLKQFEIEFNKSGNFKKSFKSEAQRLY